MFAELIQAQHKSEACVKKKHVILNRNIKWMADILREN